MHFESPKASVAIQSLIGSIDKQGIDSESFRRLLWLINAHPTLIGHGQVFANVLALLQTKSFQIDALDWASDWKKDVSSWIEVCTWITSQRLEISLLPGLNGLNRAPSGRHPLVGEGVDRHAVAAALWSRHESAAQYPPQTSKSGEAAWVFFEIQGHLLASYADARYRFSSLEFFENHSHDLEQPVAPIRTGPIGLAMREFSRQKYAPMLVQIKPNSRTPDFALSLCATTFDFSVVSDDVGDDSDRYLASTVRYFRRVSDVLSGWKPSAASRRGGGGGGAAPRLLAILGDSNPVDMSTLQLEDYYAELVTDLDPLAPIKDIASGVRDFHAYLHKTYRKPLMRKEAEVLGDENSLKPVDANLIDFDEYAKAQEYLDHARCDAAERKICKIVLMLAFKAGMRRMEVFGMQVRDIQTISRLTCVIRPNANRRLKTSSSQRIVPLYALLTKDERELLQEWLAQRISEVKSAQPDMCQQDIDSHFVFDLFNSPRYESWVDRITDRVCAAIRSVTGDEGLFIHHLRHAFGTWTYLRLRSPDFPNIANRFQHLHQTAHALKTGRRLRILLLGYPHAADRSLAFAVGRLLGHSSPTVSMGHYIHAEDILIGEVVRRECANVPKAVILSVSGLQKSAAYEQIADSVDALLNSCRRAHGTITTNTNNESKTPIKLGRKSNPLPHQRAEWVSLTITEDILKLAIDSKCTSEEVSKIVKIDVQKVQSILEQAHALADHIGLKKNQNGEITESPTIPKDKDAQTLFLKLNKVMADLYFRAPLAYTQGTEIALNHFDTQKRDIVFRGKKHLKEAKQLFNFFKFLSIPDQDFNWLIRKMDANDATLPDWTDQINIDWSPSVTKVIRPKSASGSASYAQWAGVYPVDTDGESLGTTLIRSIFLSKISNLTLETLLISKK